MNSNEELLQALSFAEKLQINFEYGKIKYQGRSIVENHLPNIYRNNFEIIGANQGLYLEPSKFWGMLVEISQASKIVEMEKRAEQFPINSMEDFINQEKKALNIQISPIGTWQYSVNGDNNLIDYSREKFMAHLKNRAFAYNSLAPKEAFKIPIDGLTCAMAVHLTTMVDRRKLDLRETLRYRQEADCPDEAIKWLLKVYYIEPNAANLAAFKHLLWSIKRCIWDLSIELPLFYCFHSKQQAIGKTQLIRRLATNFEWIYSKDGILRNLLKEQDTKAMLRGFNLIDFQELSIGNIRDPKTGAIDDSVVSRLKAVITSDTMSGRIMYDSENGMEAKRVVFTSSTNKHIWEVISDPTGMRRYWEFELQVPSRQERERAGNVEFYKEANHFFENIVEIYQGINELDDRGFYYPNSPEWDEMTEIQSTYSRENPLLTFIKHHGWKFHHDACPEASEVPLGTLADKFNRKLDENRQGKWDGKLVAWNITQHFDIGPKAVLNSKGRFIDTYFIEGWK